MVSLWIRLLFTFLSHNLMFLICNQFNRKQVRVFGDYQDYQPWAMALTIRLLNEHSIQLHSKVRKKGNILIRKIDTSRNPTKWLTKWKIGWRGIWPMNLHQNITLFGHSEWDADFISAWIFNVSTVQPLRLNLILLNYLLQQTQLEYHYFIDTCI